MARKKAAVASFEEMMKRLTEIVAKMESRDVPIEEAISLYEEGHGLVTELRAILDRAEEKVRLLDPDADGADYEKDRS